MVRVYSEKWYEIKAILFRDSYCKFELIESDVCDISNRIEKYDKDMFIVFNKLKRKYEIHSLEFASIDATPKETFQTTIPYDNLDCRALEHLHDNDIRLHGRKIFERIDQQEGLREKQKQREFKNWVHAVANETKSMFAKDAWL